MNHIDEPMSDDEVQQIKQAFSDGVECAKVLFRMASDRNMSSRQLAVASMLVLTVVSKHDGLPIEHVLEMFKNVWDGTEFSTEDLH